MVKSTTRDMTKGSPWKLIAGFALPVLLSQIFQQLYNTADTLIVGRFLGDEALAAVSSSGPLIFLLISFFEGLTMGASVTISRYFGADDKERVQRAIHTNILVSTMSGLFLTGFGIIMTPHILGWMGTDPEVLPDAIAYFRYYFMGILSVVLYNACKSIMNALGSVLEKDRWIIDGNYSFSMEMRLKKCDAVFFLDYPAKVCLDGVRTRMGKPRPDMPWIEQEYDEEFIQFIKSFKTERCPQIYALLEKYSDKPKVVFKTRAEAEEFLEAVRDKTK